MNVKLKNVEILSENVFVVTTVVDGKLRKDKITRNDDIELQSSGETFVYFTAEAHDFHNVWGSSLELRKKLRERIKNFELQPA